jgi:hypothetical protein
LEFHLTAEFQTLLWKVAPQYLANEAAKLETVSCNEYYWPVASLKGEIK